MGANGTSPRLSTVSAGTPGMYTSGTCASGFRAFFGGSRLLYALDLGAGVPLGGTLTVTTCGHSANDTVLYVGTGCPAWDRPFGCIVGNDNAAACGGNGLSSSVLVTATQSMYYVQVGGYAGSHVVSGLGWSYVAPASRSGSGSRSRSRGASGSRTGSPTRSRSGSRSGSRSRSRKAK